MSLVDDPDDSIDCPPATCRGCGADLAVAPVTAWRRHQVTDIEPAPAPKVTEYVAQAKQCAGCGAVSVGELPAHVRARASYGPETCAQAANLVSGHHIPVYRATPCWAVSGRAGSLRVLVPPLTRTDRYTATVPAVRSTSSHVIACASSVRTPTSRDRTT